MPSIVVTARPPTRDSGVWQERTGTPMLGREFLLQTIRMYGSPLQGGVGECSRQSINALVLQSGDKRRPRKDFETPLES